MRKPKILPPLEKKPKLPPSKRKRARAAYQRKKQKEYYHNKRALLPPKEPKHIVDRHFIHLVRKKFHRARNHARLVFYIAVWESVPTMSKLRSQAKTNLLDFIKRQRS